jgi:hypothetical protein
VYALDINTLKLNGTFDLMWTLDGAALIGKMLKARSHNTNILIDKAM